MPRAGSGDGVHWRCGPSFWDNVIMGGTAGSVVSCRRTFSTTSIMSGRAQPRALRLSGPMTVFSCVLFVPSPLLTFHNLSLFWLLFFVSYQLHYHLQYMPASAYQSLPVHMNHLCPRFFLSHLPMPLHAKRSMTRSKAHFITKPSSVHIKCF